MLESHAFEFDAVRIKEVYGIVVFIVLGRRIDNVDVVRVEERLQLIDITAACQLSKA
jgi:hypothetical protein